MPKRLITTIVLATSRICQGRSDFLNTHEIAAADFFPRKALSNLAQHTVRVMLIAIIQKASHDFWIFESFALWSYFLIASSSSSM